MCSDKRQSTSNEPMRGRDSRVSAGMDAATSSTSVAVFGLTIVIGLLFSEVPVLLTATTDFYSNVD